MTIVPTHSELRSMLESKQFEEVFKLLSKYYDQCRTRLFEIHANDSQDNECAILQSQLHWLNELLGSWPVRKRQNKIPLFMANFTDYDVTTTLRRLGLERHEVLQVKTSLEILTLSANPQASIDELEELAIRCGEMSKCRFCEHAQITTEYSTEEMKFRGCLANPEIKTPIFGLCSVFSRRDTFDE